MKSRLPLLLISFLFLFPSNFYAQNASPTEAYYERLYHLGKVWGYVKYFHPNIARCNYGWDSELLTTVELVKAAKSDAEFNVILGKMIDNVGAVSTTSLPVEEIAEEYSYNLDLNWFDAPIFTDLTKEKLVNLRDNFRSRNHCLLKEAYSGGNPTFGTDDGFFEGIGSYPNEAQRVLGIFRYWNIINYFFPYKYQLDQNWDETFQQFIPPIVSATNALNYHLSFKEMTTYINDSHAFFISQPYFDWSGSYIAPFILKLVEGQSVVVKVHSSVTKILNVGDIVTSIDGEEIQSRRNQIRKYTSGSNSPTIERNISSSIVRGNSGLFKLKLKNKNGEKTLNLTRKGFSNYESMYSNKGQSYKKIIATGGCEVGYIDMDLLTKEQVPTMFSSFNNLPAIIVDIRNYPQGTLWEMVDFLYARPVNFASFTQPNIRYPGILKFHQHSIGRGGRPYQGKLVLLFDEDTQSQAEFTVMGLEKHPGALKVGSQTAGADGNVSSIYLPGGIRTVFTGLGVFYPDGTETQRIGMVPDIEFKPTIKGIQEGRDEMLEFVLDCELLNAKVIEVFSEDGVDVFPNPTNNQIGINAEKSGEYRIIVTDAIGRFIERIYVGSNSFQTNLDLSNYQSGLYLLTFEDEKGIFATKKIIKF